MPWADEERRLRAVPGMLKKVQGGKLGSAGRHLAPGAGPDPGRFTCSLIRERGGEGAGLGERQRVGTGRLGKPCRRWREKFSFALYQGWGNVPTAPGSYTPLLGGIAMKGAAEHPWGTLHVGWAYMMLSCRLPQCHPGIAVMGAGGELLPGCDGELWEEGHDSSSPWSTDCRAQNCA